MGSVQGTTIIGRRALEHHAKSRSGIIAGRIVGYAEFETIRPAK
jgi:hypothetical protein